MYLRHQVMFAFTVVASKNGVTLCKLDINVKDRSLVASASLNLGRNSLKEQEGHDGPKSLT